MTNDLSESVLLGDVAQVFKGRSVKATLTRGNIGLITIKDIIQSQIAYEQLLYFHDDPTKLAPYFLDEGDILITSKGTVLKIAVFQKQSYPILASANLTIIRPAETLRSYYIKLFLETKAGRQQLLATDRGKKVMNLSTQGIKHIRIPLLPLVKQDYQLARYLNGKTVYQRKIERAKKEWQYLEADVISHLFSKTKGDVHE